ncbi:MAG: 50S ribosomal protein L10 [Chloroflexi bacterium]|nr:50S ribosomal protein L10 [Chloroflexota bacterium]
MPVTREIKEEMVAELTAEFKKSQALIFADYRGVPTAELAKLRNQLRGMKSGLHVTKNTLVALALERAGLPVPQDLLEGPNVIAFCYTDIAGTARAINDFLKDREVKVRGAIMGQTVMRGAETAALANLPTREQALGRLLGTIIAPGTQIAGVVASGIRQVLYLLKARAEQLEKQGAAA